MNVAYRLSRPSGTCLPRRTDPSDESLGYGQSPRRGWARVATEQREPRLAGADFGTDPVHGSPGGGAWRVGGYG